MRIKTLPADADPYALTLARSIAEWFRTAGIDATVLPMPEQELQRQSLLRNEFDLFVMRLPARFRDPDALMTLVHSRHTDDAGWQNPFGYANLDVDDALERQRRTNGARRRSNLATLQRTLARSQPFTILTVPDDIRAVQADRFIGWQEIDLNSPVGYLQLDGTADTESTLDSTMTDGRPTRNLNPCL